MNDYDADGLSAARGALVGLVVAAALWCVAMYVVALVMTR